MDTAGAPAQATCRRLCRHSAEIAAPHPRRGTEPRPLSGGIAACEGACQRIGRSRVQAGSKITHATVDVSAASVLLIVKLVPAVRVDTR